MKNNGNASKEDYLNKYVNRNWRFNIPKCVLRKV